MPRENFIKVNYNILIYTNIIGFMYMYNQSSNIRKKIKLRPLGFLQECSNCQNIGHSFKNCKFPVTSYGIMGFKMIKGKLKTLMIRRRDTIGFIDFIRGRYDQTTDSFHQNINILFGEMTVDEKKRIIDYSFDELWEQTWINKNSRIYKNEYFSAKRKYERIDAVNIAKDTLEFTNWKTPEFGIPKGRMNSAEHPLDCAIREFSEETGKLASKLVFLPFFPLEEVFTGSNGVVYRHVYYLAKIENDSSDSDFEETGEVSQIKWAEFREAYNIFRTYEVSKRRIIASAFNIVSDWFGHVF